MSEDLKKCVKKQEKSDQICQATYIHWFGVECLNVSLGDGMNE